MSNIFSFLISSSPFFSITLAEGLILIGLFYLGIKFLRGKNIEYPPFFLPLIAFAISSITSALLSLNPKISIPDTKEIFLYFIPPLVLLLKKEWLKHGLVIGGGLAAFLGIIRYFTIREPRLTGFAGHYMTEGGLMMMLSLFLLSLIIFEKPSLIYILSLLSASMALLLTLTRSAWVGAVLGVLFLSYKWKRWATIMVIPAIVIAVIISPKVIRDRALSIFSKTNPTNVERLHMWRIGLRMAKDRPFFGIGQNMASKIYPEYNKEKLPPLQIPHLHDTYLQILVERGSIGLLLYLLFLYFAFFGLKKLGNSPIVLGALSSLIGFVVAGLFEYNFGDSEVRILLFIIISLPYIKEV